MNRLRGLNTGGAYDELDHEDLIRRQEQAERVREAPLVRINPPGARNGRLGGQADVTAGGRLFSLVDFRVEDEDALPFTVTLVPVITPASFGAAFDNDWRPFANIQFGTYGALMQVEVDIGRGCQIVLGGSTCQVQVGADANTVSAAVQELPLAAMLSMWSTARQRPSYRTRYVDALGAGATSGFLNIPNFAQTLEIGRSRLGGVLAPVSIEISDTTQAEIYSYVLSAGAQQTMPIALSCDAAFVRITNDGGGDVDARLMFGLCL